MQNCAQCSAIVLHREDNLLCESFITDARTYIGLVDAEMLYPSSMRRRKFLSHSSQKKDDLCKKQEPFNLKEFTLDVYYLKYQTINFQFFYFFQKINFLVHISYKY